MRRSLVCVLVSLSACGGGPAADGGPADLGPRDASSSDSSAVDLGADAHCTTDADGDGHVSIACGGDDCDDADPNRYPTNMEVCDAAGHDEDCNPTTPGPDVDHDGAPSTTCCNAQPAGPNVCGTDCDDTEANIHAGAPESCNGVDDNCNGMVDEGFQDSCSTRATGLAECWGVNWSGQLGVSGLPSGGASLAPTPVYVSGGLTDVGEVAAGSQATCAVTHAGDLYCWGASVGDGTSTEHDTPVLITLP